MCVRHIETLKHVDVLVQQRGSTAASTGDPTVVMGYPQTVISKVHLAMRDNNVYLLPSLLLTAAVGAPWMGMCTGA